MNIRLPGLLLTSILAIGCSASDMPVERSYIESRSAADEGVPPFSGAVRVGDTLYMSGAIGLDENNEVPDTAAEEARLVMESVKSYIDAAGMTMDDIVTMQIFCSDVSHYQAFNDVYRTYFTREYPARAFIGAGTLLFNARFEVQGIAVKR